MVTIKVRTKSVYGVDRTYVESPSSARMAIEGLTGKKTIDDNDISALQTLGIEVEELNK